MVGRWVSFWVLAYFQGRAVKLRGGKRSTKSGDVFSFKFRKRNMFKPLRLRKKPRKQRARPRVLFCFPAMGENFSSVQKGWVFGKENSLPLCETKNHEVLCFFWNQLWHDQKNGCLTWDILRAAVLLRFPNFNFWNDFGPVGNRKKINSENGIFSQFVWTVSFEDEHPWKKQGSSPKRCASHYMSMLFVSVTHMGVSKNRGTPKFYGLQWKALLKWMIWGYPYFRKHPYLTWF